MFFQIFLAVFFGLAMPARTHQPSNKANTTIAPQDGSGGEEGHVPPSANIGRTGRPC
ncbi:hypothetical protein [Mucilaginibacter paludis]|uniref:Uncharacterized protein n=1 Tax=Mucilaginibacter paludis DSM 18603 TaxID=714943 RepID=H1Y8H0_9SPHI|nr:hypothetical protein [Mucilaginibacter paludis]EHQ25888.1 hypothetical protein Mucpa_1734 [Mucilaginibacter paludis DSM 18603]